jgi:hypothetical protein
MRHSGIEPHVIIIWIENDWHSVVDGCRHRIRNRCQDRTRLYGFSTGLFPPVPDTGESKQLAFIDFKTLRLLGFPVSLPFVKTVSWNDAPAGF